MAMNWKNRYQALLLAALLGGFGCSDDDGVTEPGADQGGKAPDAGASKDGATAADGAAPQNDGASVGSAGSRCSSPRVITLSNGRATVKGDTLGAKNEFGSAINCGDMMGPWKGPQVYFKVKLTGGKTYKVTMDPEAGDMALYAFPAATACSATAINFACAGHARDTPDLPGGTSGKAESLLLTPKATGPWIIVADAYDKYQASKFTLSIAPFARPANHRCSAAKAVNLTPGAPTVIKGDTIGCTDEHSKLVCGQPADKNGKLYTFRGPQVYYKVQLKQGTKYRINLKPDFSARLYLFEASAGCGAGAVESACAAGGGKGLVTTVGMEKSKDVFFTPAGAGPHLVAVDSVNPILYGPFTLTVAEHIVSSLTPPFTLDFDSTCKGLTGTGDWECGKLAFKAGKNCKLGSKVFGKAPSKPHSGTSLWGTVLNDCYNALGNNNKVDDKAGTCSNASTGDDSVLRLKVPLPAGWTKASLSYYSWEDLNSPYDWAEIRVDGQVMYQHCEKTYKAPTAWVKRTVDLSKHAGKTVEVTFHFMASSFVNYAGWYIDDLSVTGS